MNGFQGYDQWKTASPYDEMTEEPENCDFAAAFPDYSSPAALYHATYKYTACGPSIGFHIRWIEYGDNGEGGPHNPGDQEREKWIYCDDLRELPNWADLAERGILIDAISVSSIVEGVDQECQTIVINCDPYGGDDPEAIANDYWQAVEDVDAEANDIWRETHGCPHCGDYPEGDLRPIDVECKHCHGEGAIL